MKLSFVSFVLVASSMAGPASFGQSLIQQPATIVPLPLPPSLPLPARFEVIPYSGGSMSDVMNAAQQVDATIPLGALSVVASKDSKLYNDVIVGTTPTTTTTNIHAVLVPLIINIAGSVFDPTILRTCPPVGPTTVGLAADSPIFQTNPLIMNGVSVGTVQYNDGFRRAEFDTVGGLAPTYHTQLNLTLGPAVTINFPALLSTTLFSGCGQLGIVDITALDILLRSLAGLSVVGGGPTAFPIFLTTNVVFANAPNLVGTCCILGYHSAFNATPNTFNVQTYAAAEYESTGDFGSGIQDVAILSHEVGEWMDDPLGINPTPRWAFGQVGTSCTATTGGQTNWEVGDPLTGTPFPGILNANNGVTYHPQELAFFSWFYNSQFVPSLGTGGKFSNNGTLNGPSKVCPPGGTF